MSVGDPAPPPPTRVGPSPIHDAIATELARTDITLAQRRANVRTIIINAAMAIVSTLPRSATLGNITVTITAAVHGPGPNDIRMATTATRDGQPLPGWDPDQVIRNPRLDMFDDAAWTVTEDPLGRIMNELLDVAVKMP